MNVLLLTTCICNDENIGDLKRLISSINRVEKIGFTHLVLLQNSSSYSDEELHIEATNYSFKTLKIDKVISLSKARNILIAEAKKQDLLDKSGFISFPDDDCWYPNDFWDNFSKLQTKEKFDFFYTDFSSTPSNDMPDENTHNTSNLIRYASSNTSFYKIDLFKEAGLFDENFGVGSKNNGGEDLDFAIKALLVSKSTCFLNLPIIGHRDPLPEFRYKYFQGSFGVLNKYKFKNVMLAFHFFRKFAIGIIFLLSGKIKLSDFKTVK
jgi:hypothetical protein